MIKNFNFKKFKNPYKGFKRSELGERLAKLQRDIKELDIPVLIIVDGWESSGKGFVINDLTRELDPRTFKVEVFENPTDEERSRSFLWRFWKAIPMKGNIAVFDRSFYFKIMNDIKISAEELERDIKDISSIEKELFDDKMIIIKFFLHQKQKTQKKRIEILEEDENRRFFITERDLNQKRNYKEYLDHFDKILEMSNFSYSPWHILSSEKLKSASRYILGTSIDLIEERLENMDKSQGEKFERTYIGQEKIIENIDLSLSVEEELYENQLKDLQEEAQKIAYKFYTKGIPCVLAFEGMDAAGKGGAIERLTKLIDPRGYEVVPVSAPDKTENKYHYLWRFYRNFPSKGRMTIFDRSWYGRVLVERIEGFASVEEWDRAYDEINQMEKHLSNFGTLLLKFFICIDKDEQLNRFHDRQAEEDKLYKLTDEDWRNREKWDEYILAMDEMLLRTNTDYAPWIIVEGNDKRYARLKVLKTFISYGNEIVKRYEKC